MGNEQDVFDPTVIWMWMMVVSVCVGLIASRSTFGWPNAPWLRSGNLLRRSVAVLAYFLACYLPILCVVLVLWAGLDHIPGFSKRFMAQPWQLRFGEFSAVLVTVWVLGAVWFIRMAMKPPGESAAPDGALTSHKAIRPLTERDRQVAERKRADADGLVEAWKLRCLGLLMLALGVIATYQGVYLPYIAMHDGFTSVEIKFPVVVFVPYALAFGLAYGVVGPSAHDLLGNAQTPNWPRRAFNISALVAGVVLCWWLDQQMPGA